MTDLIKKFNSGEKIIGTLTHMKSSSAIEVLSLTGIDFVMLDMEHNLLSNDEISRYITSASAAGLPAFVRVSSGTREHILHMLDYGATGIVVPSISTVEQVKEIIKYAKFMPLGERGYCMTRDGKWGFSNESVNGLSSYMSYCNQNTLLIPQCETVGCLEHIEEITALDGVDAILIGPYDLSIDMGIAGQFDNPLLKNAIDRILSACRKNKKMAINFSGTPELAAKSLKDGFDAVLYGIDIIMYINMYKNAVSQIKELIK